MPNQNYIGIVDREIESNSDEQHSQIGFEVLKKFIIAQS